MAKDAEQVAKSQAENVGRKIVIRKGGYHNFKFAGTAMRIRVNPGETFTVHDDKKRPPIRRVDRTVSSDFASELVRTKQAEWSK